MSNLVSVRKTIIKKVLSELMINRVFSRKEISDILKKDHRVFINDSSLRKFIRDIREEDMSLMIKGSDRGYTRVSDIKDMITDCDKVIERADNQIMSAIRRKEFYLNLKKEL